MPPRQKQCINIFNTNTPFKPFNTLLSIVSRENFDKAIKRIYNNHMATHDEFIKNRASLTNESEDDDKYLVGPDYQIASHKLNVEIDKWQDKLIESMQYGDPMQMATDSAPYLQANLIRMAHTSKDDSIKLSATKYVLEQSGVGPVKNISVSHTYDNLPSEQLVAMARAKFENLQKNLPRGELAKMFGVVEAEVVEKQSTDQETPITEAEVVGER